MNALGQAIAQLRASSKPRSKTTKSLSRPIPDDASALIHIFEIQRRMGKYERRAHHIARRAKRTPRNWKPATKRGLAA